MYSSTNFLDSSWAQPVALAAFWVPVGIFLAVYLVRQSKKPKDPAGVAGQRSGPLPPPRPPLEPTPAPAKTPLDASEIKAMYREISLATKTVATVFFGMGLFTLIMGAILPLGPTSDNPVWGALTMAGFGGALLAVGLPRSRRLAREAFYVDCVVSDIASRGVKVRWTNHARFPATLTYVADGIRLVVRHNSVPEDFLRDALRAGGHGTLIIAHSDPQNILRFVPKKPETPKPNAEQSGRHSWKYRAPRD